MSENLKNIDIIYRKELRDYSQSAPADVWSNIEQEIVLTKKKRNFTFYKIAAAIVSLTLIGSIYMYLNEDNKIENLPIAENQSSNENVTKPEIKEQIALEIKEEKTLSEEKIESKVFNSEDLLAENRFKVDEDGVINQEETKESVEKVYTKLDKIKIHPILIVFESADRGIIDNRNAKVNRILNSMPEFNNTLALDDFSDKPKQDNNKWALGGEFSPLYSYRLISGTPNKDFYDDVESPVVAYTGGLNFQYKPLKRLTVQVGIYYSTMGQALDNMSVYENSAFSLVPEEYKDRYITEYSLDNSTGGINLNSAYIFVDERADRVSNLTNSKSNVDLSNPVFNNLEAEIQQTFQYIEVPFLLRYKLIDKLIDVNFVGGVGANFLIGNDVYLAYGDSKENIGYTDGVSDINYNGTVGIGIEYPLLKRINIRFEPSIKYYLNEINPTSHVESHPYSLGFYTGINYSF